MKSERASLILLCGGKSSRMGTPKGLLALKGQTWLERQMLGFQPEPRFRTVIVVLGHDSGLYFRALPFLEEAARRPISRDGMSLAVALNREPERGPFSSLLSGLELLDQESGTFVLPIDVPAPGPETWSLLGTQQDVDVCIPEFNVRHGHPVWLSHSFIQALRRVPADSPGARLDFQIHSIPEARRRYLRVTDDRVTLNLNVPMDFEQFINREPHR